MPRQMPTTLRPRIALKPAEEASSSRSKSAAVVPDVNAPSRTVRPPFRLFDPFTAGLSQFQPTAFMAPARTSVATEFNSGEHTYSTTKSRSPSIRKPRQFRREDKMAGRPKARPPPRQWLSYATAYFALPPVVVTRTEPFGG